MPAKKSRWQIDHAGCQKTITRLREDAERLRGERDRLVRALYMVGNVDLLAQCPCCLAERTNGEHHDAGCALGAGVIQ